VRWHTDGKGQQTLVNETSRMTATSNLQEATINQCQWPFDNTNKQQLGNTVE